ncbi:MAG: FAD-binding oxidoreductase [Oligoflexales bacterium]
MIDQKHIEYFRSILTADLVKNDPQSLESYGRDWTKKYEPQASVVVFPKSTTQVAKILSYCSKEKLALVPSGGRTGLAGGAVALAGEVVVSLEKMNKILDIDTINLTIKTEAGVTLQTLQEAAKTNDLFFPLDLAAKGSCHIGGNIATNAGGLKFIRFGGAREQVLGLTVVLADGSILDLDSKVRKDNTGYDLKQWFIGSEGTLGIITEASLKLSPKPQSTQLCFLALNSCDDILAIVSTCHKQQISITACEYFGTEALNLVLDQFKQMQNPFESSYPFYLLLEVEGSNEAMIESFLEPMFNQGYILDAIIPQSSAQVNEIWAIRENIPEALFSSGPLRKNDISIPISSLAKFEIALQECFAKAALPVKMISFGHVGDGNLHINYLGSNNISQKEFYKQTDDLEKAVYQLVKSFNGSISAEHGIGILKKNDLSFRRSSLELELMRKIKSIFDPDSILNPGKLFDR